jgi:hypothetical protein
MTGKRKPTLSDLLIRLFSKSARPEAEDGDAQQHQQRPPPSPRRTQQQRDENVNPPHNPLKDNIWPDERARRIKEANRQYFKAAGSIEAFWAIYPSERPPEREREPKREPQRERGGRGNRD